MTHLDDAHAALMRAVASDGGVAVVGLSVAQAVALLDEAARLVAERDRLRAALERYADEMNWALRWVEGGCDSWIAAERGPTVARAALKEE